MFKDSLKEKISCQCMPKINIKGAVKPYGNGIVVLGDSGISKLYKNGIGAAYLNAKAAAKTAVFKGISEDDFYNYFYKDVRNIEFDNKIGKFIFVAASILQKIDFMKRGVLQAVENEHKRGEYFINSVFWDIFTGSSSYASIMNRMIKPKFWGSVMFESLKMIFSKKRFKVDYFTTDEVFGKSYQDGEIVIKEGEKGDKMYLIIDGEAEVYKDNKLIATLKKGDFFGEMALFGDDIRSATVKAKNNLRVITIDKTTLLDRISEDPTLAFKIIQRLSEIVKINNEKIVNNV
jgi:hypothetical protein